MLTVTVSTPLLPAYVVCVPKIEAVIAPVVAVASIDSKAVKVALVKLRPAVSVTVMFLTAAKEPDCVNVPVPETLKAVVLAAATTPILSPIDFTFKVFGSAVNVVAPVTFSKVKVTVHQLYLIQWMLHHFKVNCC